MNTVGDIDTWERPNPFYFFDSPAKSLNDEKKEKWGKKKTFS